MTPNQEIKRMSENFNRRKLGKTEIERAHRETFSDQFARDFNPTREGLAGIAVIAIWVVLFVGILTLLSEIFGGVQ